MRIEIRAGEGGQDACELVKEQYQIYVKADTRGVL